MKPNPAEELCTQLRAMPADDAKAMIATLDALPDEEKPLAYLWLELDVVSAGMLTARTLIDEAVALGDLAGAQQVADQACASLGRALEIRDVLTARFGGTVLRA